MAESQEQRQIANLTKELRIAKNGNNALSDHIETLQREVMNLQRDIVKKDGEIEELRRSDRARSRLSVADTRYSDSDSLPLPPPPPYEDYERLEFDDEEYYDPSYMKRKEERGQTIFTDIDKLNMEHTERLRRLKLANKKEAEMAKAEFEAEAEEKRLKRLGVTRSSKKGDDELRESEMDGRRKRKRSARKSKKRSKKRSARKSKKRSRKNKN
jgi:hypothetical protein